MRELRVRVSFRVPTEVLFHVEEGHEIKAMRALLEATLLDLGATVTEVWFEGSSLAYLRKARKLEQGLGAEFADPWDLQASEGGVCPACGRLNFTGSTKCWECGRIKGS